MQRPAEGSVPRSLELEWFQQGEFRCEMQKAAEARTANGGHGEFPARLDQQGHRVTRAQEAPLDRRAPEAGPASEDQQEPWVLREKSRVSQR